MAKYSLEQKLAVVKEYLVGDKSYKTLEEESGIDKLFIMKWVGLYELHGIDGLTTKYTDYTIEFKMDVLKYMKDTGTSHRKTAAIFNIPAPSTVLKWLKDFNENGIDALKSKKRGRPTMKKDLKQTPPVEGSQEALLAEIERLRMENAYLKKLNALVQEKERLQNKTKHK